MKKASKLVALMLALVMAASMAACGSSSSAPAETTAAAEAETEAAAEEGAETEAAEEEVAAEGEKVFRYAVTTEPTTLDQSKGNSIGDNEVQRALTETLVRTNEGVVEPGLAETWEVSEDGLTYTFHLREGLKWSDGEPLTANDVVYGFQRLVSPETASPYAWIVSTTNIKNGQEAVDGTVPVEEMGVSAPDENTVVIELNLPTGYFLNLIGTCTEFTPVRKDKVEEFGEDFAATADKNVYSGPFVLASSENQVLVFEKNPNYWNAEAVHFDRVELSVVPDAATQISMYESGELDMVYVPVDQVELYDDEDEEYINGNDDFIYINCASETQPLLQDPNFRLALNYAVDREDYIQLGVAGVYHPLGSLVLPQVQGAEKTYGEEYADYLHSFPLKADVAKAQEYLKLAMDAAGISDPSEITLHFTCTDNETEKKIVETIQFMWKENLGINVEIAQITYGEKYTKVYPEGNFEVGYGGWGPDFSDPFTYLDLYRDADTNANNYSNYKNDEFDALLESSRHEADPKARMDMLADAENILLDTGAVVPLQYRVQHYLIDEDVTGIRFSIGAVNLDWPFGDCDPQ